MEALLPPAQPSQPCVTVSVINGGQITLPDHCFLSPSNADDKRTVPSLAFLIEHHGSNLYNKPGRKSTRCLFDLGLRSHLDRYMSAAQAHLENNRVPYRLGPALPEMLRAGGLEPKDIDVVLLSHVHYDHHGDPEHFEESTFIVGAGSLEVLRNGIPGKGSHQAFDPNLLPKERTVELPAVGDSETTNLKNGLEIEWTWKPVGPFPASIDVFGDQSVYIIDSPGHLPGHINLLCRKDHDKWLYLKGDSAHDPRLLTGEKEIGTWENENGETLCIHLDRSVAEETIKRIRKMKDLEGAKVEVILAHDDFWFAKNKAKAYPNIL